MNAVDCRCEWCEAPATGRYCQECLSSFEGVNLDGYSIEPEDYRALNAAWFVAYGYDPATARTLELYAQRKRVAMTSRIDGDIPCALAMERECDRIYKDLPEWARW